MNDPTPPQPTVLTLRVPEALVRELKAVARREDRSLSAECRRALSRHAVYESSRDDDTETGA